MKKIAIVTGASGGIGQLFVQALLKEALDEIWVVGRNEQYLLALKDQFGQKIVPICKDLTKRADLLSFSNLIRERNSTVQWLINNAGIARMASSKAFSHLAIEQMIDLNCKAPILLINICIPFMAKGSNILLICMLLRKHWNAIIHAL